MIGIDIVDVSRIARAVETYGERFLTKVFTDEEIRYVEGKKGAYQSLAGRFAAKEAFMKALGRPLSWREIEVSEIKGRPFILFHGQRYEGVSISHEKAYAVSVVMI
ncbi:MAG: holo-[acyl-carrier-protein] synthase [Syntrophus sp. (in: bacteria)]|nr:holo-[acyl-carrier-protein] synthase [Syntrophus sp. (in: bacteria)]